VSLPHIIAIFASTWNPAKRSRSPAPWFFHFKQHTESLSVLYYHESLHRPTLRNSPVHRLLAQFSQFETKHIPISTCLSLNKRPETPPRVVRNLTQESFELVITVLSSLSDLINVPGYKSKNKCLLSPHSQICENCKFFGLECTFLREKKKRYPKTMTVD
jgi:hypothetical protein